MPNHHSAISNVTATSAAYMPIARLFTNRWPTAVITRIPMSSAKVGVMLCALRRRYEHVSASLYQPFQRFHGIGFREEDEDHNRMTDNLDPSLESSERNIRPKNCEETVKKECN